MDILTMLQLVVILMAVIFAGYQLLANWRTLSPADRLKKIKECLYSLVLESESDFGGSTGDAKRAAVIRKFYTTLPPSITRWVSYNTLVILINEAVEQMKRYFAENPTAEKNILK